MNEKGLKRWQWKKREHLLPPVLMPRPLKLQFQFSMYIPRGYIGGKIVHRFFIFFMLLTLPDLEFRCNSDSGSGSSWYIFTRFPLVIWLTLLMQYTFIEILICDILCAGLWKSPCYRNVYSSLRKIYKLANSV